MKRLAVAAAIALGLTGCVAVPYYDEPLPAAGYYHVYPAAPTIHFRYDYRRGYRDHWDHRHYRPYRHYRR